MAEPAHSAAAGSSRTRSTHLPREKKKGTAAAGAGPTGVVAAAAAPTAVRSGRDAAKLAATCAAPPLLAAGPLVALLVGRGGCRRSWWLSAALGRAPTAGRCRSCPPAPTNPRRRQERRGTQSDQIDKNLSFQPVIIEIKAQLQEQESLVVVAQIPRTRSCLLPPREFECLAQLLTKKPLMPRRKRRASLR
jgi:hypothetical protein